MSMSHRKTEYSDEDDSYLDDEPTSSRREEMSDSSGPGDRVVHTPDPEDGEDANKESFVTAIEGGASFETSTSPDAPPPEVGLGGGGGVISMSTIEEESRSYETTAPSLSFSSHHDRDHSKIKPPVPESQENQRSRSLNVSQELQELQQWVKDREAEESAASAEFFSEKDQEPPLLPHQVPSTSSHTFQVPAPPAPPRISADGPGQEQNLSAASASEALIGVDALLEKLQKLESTENVLEQILNASCTGNVDINALISQLPLDALGVTHPMNRNDSDDYSPRSISSEIASIQKIIDAGVGGGGDTPVSILSEVAGGNKSNNNNNIMLPPRNPPTSRQEKQERDIDDVLREYEEFERSLSRPSSAVDDSIRSDVSSLPPLSTYSTKADEALIKRAVAPVIKPSVLKSANSPPVKNTSAPQQRQKSSKSHQGKDQADVDMTSAKSSARDVFCPPPPPPTSTKKSHSGRTKPMTATSTSGPGRKSENSSKTSQSAHGLASPRQVNPIRVTSSSTNAPASSREREITQDAYRPRSRRMISPRGQPISSSNANSDLPKHSGDFVGGSGEGSQSQHHHHNYNKNRPNDNVDNKAQYAVTEALKTIEKLNGMVAKQETLLEAYSKDNERLWGELKENKSSFQEKESHFEDVINSLKTEVATVKLNRLVVSSNVPDPEIKTNKEELQKLREDSDVKSQQLLELRKQVLFLQSKLNAEIKSRTPLKQKSASTTVGMGVHHGVGSVVANVVAQEKEKEYQKAITGLNKQVRTLQKILYSKDATAPPPATPGAGPAQSQVNGTNRPRPLQRAKSDVINKPGGNAKQQAFIKSARNAGVDAGALLTKPMTPRGTGFVKNLNPMFNSFNKGINLNSGEVLQASLSCLEQEREEFEQIVAEKNKLLLEKEKTIVDLQEEVETLKSQFPEGDVVEPGLVDELRSRIITQNKAIQSLKEHLALFKQLEGENLVLREEKHVLEQLIRELRRKLEFAQHLGKPENEVLCLLSEKVDELNSRYYQRERQLDTLLNRLSLKTTSGMNAVVFSCTSSSDNSGGDVLSRSHGLSHRATTNTNLSPPQRIAAAVSQFSSNNGSLGGALSMGRKGRSSGLISADILHMADISPTNSFQLFNSVTDLQEM